MHPFALSELWGFLVFLLSIALFSQFRMNLYFHSKPTLRLATFSIILSSNPIPVFCSCLFIPSIGLNTSTLPSGISWAITFADLGSIRSSE